MLANFDSSPKDISGIHRHGDEHRICEELDERAYDSVHRFSV